MSQVGNVFNIPTFVRARSAQALCAAMIEKNVSEKREYQYFQIQFCADDGYWYAWFYEVSKEFKVTVKKAK